MAEQKTLEQVLGELIQKVQRVSDKTIQQEILAEIERLRREHQGETAPEPSTDVEAILRGLKEQCSPSSGVGGILRQEQAFLLYLERYLVGGSFNWGPKNYAVCYAVAEGLVKNTDFTQQDVQDYVLNRLSDKGWEWPMGILISALANKVKLESLRCPEDKPIGWLGAFNEYASIVVRGNEGEEFGSYMKGGKLIMETDYQGENPDKDALYFVGEDQQRHRVDDYEWFIQNERSPSYVDPYKASEIGSAMQGGEIVMKGSVEGVQYIGNGMEGGSIRLMSGVDFWLPAGWCSTPDTIGLGINMKGGKICIDGQVNHVENLGTYMEDGSIIINGPVGSSDIGYEMEGGRIQIQGPLSFYCGSRIAAGMSGGEIEIDGPLDINSLYEGDTIDEILIGKGSNGGTVRINGQVTINGKAPSSNPFVCSGGVELYYQGERVEASK